MKHLDKLERKRILTKTTLLKRLAPPTEDVLDAVTAGDAAEVWGITYRGARERLETLVHTGKLRRVDIRRNQRRQVGYVEA